MVALATAPVSAGLALEITSVSHEFQLDGKPLPVLQDVTLDVAPGAFVALVGPSGCGKSSLLRLVAGLDAPIAGRITADGAPVTGPDPSRVLMFQDPTLYPWRTVRANVGLGWKRAANCAAMATASMKRCNWWAWTDSRPPIRTKSPAAWRSGLPWPGRWSTTPAC